MRTTSAGKQLWWDWALDEDHYPGWHDPVAELEGEGERMLVCINPFLNTEPGHDRLFRQAEADGFLVRQTDGTPYLIRNTDFLAGSVWADIWTGLEVGPSGTWRRMPAPLGQPAAFLRSDGRFSSEIRAALREAGFQTGVAGQ